MFRCSCDVSHPRRCETSRGKVTLLACSILLRFGRDSTSNIIHPGSEQRAVWGCGSHKSRIMLLHRVCWEPIESHFCAHASLDASLVLWPWLSNSASVVAHGLLAR